ncbi:hypothetical protein [Massilia niabensis]|uniref:Uncharacterized protein n=1 Tax=Massilia niabensis TaxID=544910 RepID=A0ABW0L676_9BURK
MKSHDMLSEQLPRTHAAAAASAAAADPAYASRAGVPGQPSLAIFVAAFLYLFVPTVIVLVGFQPWKIAAPVAVAAAACLWWLALALRGQARVPYARLQDTWPFLAMAACFVWLSGVLPPFAETYDWYKHYALFNELIDQAWPAAVPNGGELSTLRYSLSYYALPAIVAKFAGHAWLGPANFVWTTLGLYLALVIAFHAQAQSVVSRFQLCAVFLLFSGADIVGRYVTGHVHPVPMHFEWWATFGQLSSSTTSLFWTPQHAISAWLGTFLILRFPQRALQCGGVLVAAIAVWSPFSAIGIVPVFIWAIFKNGWRHIFTWMNLLIAPVLLGVAGYFLTRGSAGIPAGFIWTAVGFSPGIWVVFLVLEFAAVAGALYLVERRNVALIIASAGFLALLSLFSLGAYNDLLMRASLPALAILAALSAMAVACAPSTARKTPLVICLVLGLVTPLGEIMRAIVGERVPKSETLWINDIFSGTGQFLAPQYLAPGFDGALWRTPVLELAGTTFTGFGEGMVDPVRKRIESASFTDAALVARPITLPQGTYEVEIVLDLDVAADKESGHAAHLSIHGQQLLARIGNTAGRGLAFRGYFRTKGEPVQLSFGLGGWAKGKGFVELKKLTISSVSTGGR